MYERKRLGVIELVDISHADDISISKDPEGNALTTLVQWYFNNCIDGMFGKRLLPMSILFMLGFCIALVVNYPCKYAEKTYCNAC
jgi:CitMHS family citrate-Mg2+:H+ or citrate-Ca2+:H+ symporter